MIPATSHPPTYGSSKITRRPFSAGPHKRHRSQRAFRVVAWVRVVLAGWGRLWLFVGELAGFGLVEDAELDQALELGADVLDVVGLEAEVEGLAQVAGV